MLLATLLTTVSGLVVLAIGAATKVALLTTVSGLVVLAIGAATKVALERARAARKRKTERIKLVSPPGMGPKNGYRYALMMVREGLDEVRDAGVLMNRTVWFRNDRFGSLANLLSKPDTQTSEDAGNRVQPIKGECVYGRPLVATVRYRAILGLQFKCFFDAPGPLPAEFEEMVRKVGWIKISPDQRALGRYWFVLEKYPTRITVDGYVNNFLSFVTPTRRRWRRA